jgi:hypothetical protein
MNPTINRPRGRTRILVTNDDPVFLALIRDGLGRQLWSPEDQET